ncbi:MAG: phosphoribosylformylglycinamidine synthase, partial [Candidatus Korarchaeota archaeon]|nr:phosphoribosylformylglycinamidine synthase [Candidatus Korarchaeota archaeon]NIU83312.1 phosphoribosylformylglycinamidine synthase [Candidatus Thorarchaeota archaeon]NIW13647.1 phosphoribosylformylglycinamidine synthase [Candidatus Thorarchaeota archaeon]NIW51750.1 phosphoribosylformylglycinamidine synthase [Candidatus Korarchaeota archaeon]
MKQLEVGFKDEYTDTRAEKLEEKISRLGYSIGMKVVDLYLLDGKLSKNDAQKVKNEIFVDSVTQRGRFSPLYSNFNWNWLVLVTFLPGVKDTVGERAKETIEEHLGKPYEGKVFSGKKYLLKGKLEKDEVQKIAAEIANDIIQQVTIIKREDFEGNVFQLEPPKVESSHRPTVEKFDVASMTEEELRTLSEERNLALSQDEMQTIKEYFRTPKVIEERQLVGRSSQMTDVELEVLAQTQSEHCKHKIFNAKIHYEDKRAGKIEDIDSIFDTFIKTATEEIRGGKDWILSVFWDNAGVVGFTDDFVTVMKFETHNSPSAKEPYGGAMTGIVGVYRDPMGTGKGCRIIAGSYGYCTPSPFYSGDLQPEIAPRRLLEGIVEGVRDGGNKSGIPTIYGYSQYDTSFLGKPLVYVGAIGLMPREINGEASWKKDIEDGDFIVTIGGRVGKDGIHGVTQASQEFGESITSQHVQIGDPYKQKKVHDFLVEARDEGLYRFIWDVGGGGLSSAVGETARFSNGCELHLDRV